MTTTLPDFDPQDDDEYPRNKRKNQDHDNLPTKEEIGQEAEEFHNEWSRRNPNQVYGQSFIYY